MDEITVKVRDIWLGFLVISLFGFLACTSLAFLLLDEMNWVSLIFLPHVAFSAFRMWKL